MKSATERQPELQDATVIEAAIENIASLLRIVNEISMFRMIEFLRKSIFRGVLENNQEKQQTLGNKYDQKGSMGAGHISGGEIKDEAKLLGTVGTVGTLTEIKADTVNLYSSDSCKSNGVKPPLKISSLIGTIIDQDHKYDGKLAFINLGFADEKGEQTEEIGIRLSIAFGQVEEPVKQGKRTQNLIFDH